MLSPFFGLEALSVASLPAKQNLRPDVPAFYTDLETVREAVTERCETVEVRDLRLLLDVARRSQRQIDCRGFIYRGRSSFMELMFSDDQLDLIIILFEPDDYTAIEKKFRETFSPFTLESKIGLFSYENAVALRTRPHEIVFVSRRARANYQLCMYDLAEKAAE